MHISCKFGKQRKRFTNRRSNYLLIVPRSELCERFSLELDYTCSNGTELRACSVTRWLLEILKSGSKIRLRASRRSSKRSAHSSAPRSGGRGCRSPQVDQAQLEGGRTGTRGLSRWMRTSTASLPVAAPLSFGHRKLAGDGMARRRSGCYNDKHLRQAIEATERSWRISSSPGARRA